jgi:glycosyltransferase involved in cell wall biosynthesis
MSPSPAVTVVMTVFNGERYVEKAIRSILGQAYREFEFVIVDDGSTDHTAEIVDQYAGEDARIRVVAQPNRGMVAALNRGWKLARGRYVARMDQDDLSLPHRLERQVAFLEQNPNVCLVGGSAYYISAAGDYLSTCQCPTSADQIRAALLERNCLVDSTVMVRREALEAVNGYRAAFECAEDYDLWARLSEKFDLACLREVVGCYRLSASQVSHQKLKQQATAFLTACATTRRRRETGVDLFDAAEEITPELLEEYGISQETISDAYLARLLWRTSVMLLAEGIVEARRVLEMTQKVPPACWKRSHRLALLRVRARMAFCERRYLYGVATGLRVACLDPAPVARRVLRIPLLLSLRWQRKMARRSGSFSDCWR